MGLTLPTCNVRSSRAGSAVGLRPIPKADGTFAETGAATFYPYADASIIKFCSGSK